MSRSLVFCSGMPEHMPDMLVNPQLVLRLLSLGSMGDDGIQLATTVDRESVVDIKFFTFFILGVYSHTLLGSPT